MRGNGYFEASGQEPEPLHSLQRPRFPVIGE